MGLNEGAILKRDIEKDTIIRYADVIPPKNSLIWRLRAEQDKNFPGGLT
jgi:predicted homoserine dehydrogenase-like protein